MKVNTVELHYKKNTKGIGLIDITRQIEHTVVDSKLSDGIATVSSYNHNVCITTMEFEPGAIKDVKDAFKRIGSKRRMHGHLTKNGTEKQDVIPALIGHELTIPFKDNRILVGMWQKIIMMDFNGKENEKKIVVQIVGE